MLMIAAIVIAFLVLNKLGKNAACEPSKQALAEAITEQIFPQSKVSKKAGFTQNIRDGVKRAAETGNIDISSFACSKYPAPSKTALGIQAGVLSGSLAGSLAGLGVGTTAATATSAATATALSTTLALAGVVTAVAAPFLGIFLGIIAKHKAKEAAETKIICETVPQIQSFIAQIISAYKQGNTSQQDAVLLLQQLDNDANTAFQQIIKMNSSQCNAACTVRMQIQAALARRISDLQAGCV